MTAEVNVMTDIDPFAPAVAPAIWELRPDFAALSVVVRRGRNAASEAGDAEPAGEPPPWSTAHFEAWRQAYAAFGAKPQRTSSSAEALRRRIDREGALPRINAVVDLYNVISVRYALPVGGEDVATYAGTPRLVRAVGGEPFETMRDGQRCTEIVDEGEVIWRDDAGPRAGAGTGVRVCERVSMSARLTCGSCSSGWSQCPSTHFTKRAMRSSRRSGSSRPPRVS